MAEPKVANNAAIDEDNFRRNSTQQLLTFVVGDEHYGVEILSVQEIHGWTPPRPIPNAPDYIKGVIDWRGTIVPIVDLRIRFGCAEVDYTKTTVVIILQAASGCGDDVAQEGYILGVVVDAVSDVLDIATKSLRPAPSLGLRVDTEYIQGIAKIEQQMVIILQVDKLINLDELGEA